MQQYTKVSYETTFHSINEKYNELCVNNGLNLIRIQTRTGESFLRRAQNVRCKIVDT